MREVEYWVLTPDGYDNRYMTVNTDDEQEAFDIVKETHRRSKNFKVYKKWNIFLPFNEKLLKQDIKFPLKWDVDEYKMYIFDSDNNMVAQVDYDNLDATKDYHPFEKLIGDYKEVFRANEPQWFLENGDYKCIELGVEIGLVRNWGRLQKKKTPEERQDNIAAYILNVINS
jgi:hypothetical protein